MKKYLVLFFLLASLTSFGQFSNYTNINGRYKWIAGKFDSTFTLPSGTTPSLRTGGGTGSGALFYSTTDSSVYQYTGNRWTRLRGTDTAHVISAYVRNTTGSILTPGQVVYINGSTGTTPTVALAVNTADSTSAMTFGFVRGNIAVNGFGYITTFGPLEGVNTNAYTEGEVIYLDSIPGQFTHTKPQAPYHMVTLGYIIKKSAGNGTIYAKIQNGYELEELHNVKITAPVLNKSVIIYDSVKALWVDTTVSAAGLGLGGSGTTNYLPKWTSSTALGNSLVYDNGTSVGVNTASPSASYKLDVTGAFRSTLDANINGLTIGKGAGSLSFNTAFGVSALGAITTSNENTAVGAQSLRVLTIGGGNTAVGYASGYDNISGGSNVFVGDYAGRTSNSNQNTMVGSQAGRTTTGGYNTFLGYIAGYSVSTGIYNTILGISNPGITTGNFNTIIGSQITGLSTSLSNHTILADGQGNMRLVSFNDGNVYIGGSTSLPTNSGYKLDINGSLRSNTMSLLRTDAAATLQLAQYTTGDYLNLGTTSTGTISGVVLGGNRWGNITSPGSSYIQNDYTSVSIVKPQTGNGSNNLFDISQSFNVSIGGAYTQKLQYSSGTISNTGSATYYGQHVAFTDNSSSIANTIYGVYSDVSLGTNTSATRYSGIFMGGAIGIGTTTPNASSLLDISSTSKGFLPPRMTGAQAEAISTPAAGLLVYANNGNGTTITSTGWWGYDGTNWVKLN